MISSVYPFSPFPRVEPKQTGFSHTLRPLFLLRAHTPLQPLLRGMHATGPRLSPPSRVLTRKRAEADEKPRAAADLAPFAPPPRRHCQTLPGWLLSLLSSPRPPQAPTLLPARSESSSPPPSWLPSLPFPQPARRRSPSAGRHEPELRPLRQDRLPD